MIEFKHINKTYQTASGPLTALEDINLTVKPNEIFGIIGRSGAGKSTLIRCANLLERPSSGEVSVAGQDLMTLSAAGLRQARHQIGMVFQHFNLLSSRTVYQNIALPLELMHVPKATIKEKVLPLLELVGLSDKEKTYPHNLSGGQKQRVAIARALVTEPKVLLCDEMTSALDPETTRSILQLVQDIKQRFNMSILLITHEMDVIKQVADQVAVIEQGKIIEQGPVLDIFKAPQTETTKSLIRSTLKLDLPDSLQQQLQTTTAPGLNPVLRIAFVGHTAEEPMVSDLLKHFNVNLNILQANLEFIHGDTIGIMLATAQGEQEQVTKALTYLKEKQVQAEVMGYL